MEARVGLARDPADLAAVSSLLRLYAHELVHEAYGDPTRTLEDAGNLPGRFVPPGDLLVARVGSEVVGCVGLLDLGEGTAELKRLFVVPEHRRDGIGGALVDRTLDLARSRGFRWVYLETLEGFHAARALYRARGFQDAPVEGPGKPGEVIVAMVLDLG